MLDAGGFSNSVITYFLPLVQLVILFLQEQREDEDMTLSEFGNWLAEHQFSDIKAKLDSSQQMQTAIGNLLNQNHTQTLSRFDFLDEQVAKISSQLEGFSEIARLVKPDAILSNQAIHFLKSLEDPEVGDLSATLRHGTIVEIRTHIPSNKTSSVIEITEPRFAIQDLEELASLNLLKCDNPYSEDYLVYRITRTGNGFLQNLKIQR